MNAAVPAVSTGKRALTTIESNVFELAAKPVADKNI